MPAERSGIASALLNASREVAGLLGITVIGAVLRTRQGAALRDGVHAAPAYIDGFHAGLFVTIGLALAGVLVSYLALRRFAPGRRRQPRRGRHHPGGGGRAALARCGPENRAVGGAAGNGRPAHRLLASASAAAPVSAAPGPSGPVLSPRWTGRGRWTR